MTTVTVIGGGLGGLVAAVEAAEAGAEVVLHEAHGSLGGRWRTTAAPYVAHEGPHVVYRDGPLWAWLRERGLTAETVGVPVRGLAATWFRVDGRRTRMPPAALGRVLLSRRVAAPVEVSFAEWATGRWGPRAASLAAHAAGVALFHADPGSLSAAFVWERLRRALSMPPAARFHAGGWGRMIEALGDRARGLGVRIELGSRLDAVAPSGVTIIATELESARGLLGEPELDWPSGRVALLDLGLRRSRRDAYLVSDLDEGGWFEDFARPDPSCAPAGQALIQLQLGSRAEESRSAATARIERLADAGAPGWRDRVVWRRDAVAQARTGAVDPPGTTWRDRPAVDRGGGVFLVGDRVAAPGLLSEVSVLSAHQAVRSALGASVSPAGAIGTVRPE